MRKRLLQAAGALLGAAGAGGHRRPVPECAKLRRSTALVAPAVARPRGGNRPGPLQPLARSGLRRRARLRPRPDHSRGSRDRHRADGLRRNRRRASELLGAPARPIRDFVHSPGGCQHQSVEAGNRALELRLLCGSLADEHRSRDSRPQRPREFQVRRNQIDRLSDRYGSRHLAARLARRRLEGLLRRATGAHRSLGPRPRRFRPARADGSSPRSASISTSRSTAPAWASGPRWSAVNRGTCTDPSVRACTSAGPSTTSASRGGSRWRTSTAGTCCPRPARAGLSTSAAASICSPSKWSCRPPPRATRRCRFPCASAPAIT